MSSANPLTMDHKEEQFIAAGAERARAELLARQLTESNQRAERAEDKTEQIAKDLADLREQDSIRRKQDKSIQESLRKAEASAARSQAEAKAPTKSAWRWRPDIKNARPRMGKIRQTEAELFCPGCNFPPKKNRLQTHLKERRCDGGFF